MAEMLRDVLAGTLAEVEVAAGVLLAGEEGGACIAKLV